MILVAFFFLPKLDKFFEYWKSLYYVNFDIYFNVNFEIYFN